MAFVQLPGGAALEDVQADEQAVGIGPVQQRAQDGRTEPPALDTWGEIEMLQPLPVLGRPHGDAAREGAAGQDDRGVPRGEGIPQPLPDPMLVEPAQPLQVRAHHQGP